MVRGASNIGALSFVLRVDVAQAARTSMAPATARRRVGVFMTASLARRAVAPIVLSYQRARVAGPVPLARLGACRPC
ncbi:hypothetical protein GCM10025759_11860 [Lysobacter panacisoli]|uniref:Uncharacterized protein n=1 Tax=Lysobacter panacisoli TaxID=1255263 RepID=A0ABP9L6J5_9GAMM